MKKKFNFIVVFFVVVALFGMTSTCLAGDAVSLPIIGKAFIKEGTMLVIILVVSSTQPVVGAVEAFEDQELYITKKIKPLPGQHRGGYMLDGQGFISNCPVHGREVMGVSMIPLAVEMVESEEVRIELF